MSSNPRSKSQERRLAVQRNPLTGPALAAEVERIVFGDDLGCFAADGTERRERIKDAVYQWSVSAPLNGVRDLWEQPVSVASDRFLSMWDNRHNVESCADLEAHVASYRAAPRPFDSDPALALEALHAVIDGGRMHYAIRSGDSHHVEKWDRLCEVMRSDEDSSLVSFGESQFSEFPDAPPEQQRVLAFCAAVCRAAIAKEQANG